MQLRKVLERFGRVAGCVGERATGGHRERLRGMNTTLVVDGTTPQMSADLMERVAYKMRTLASCGRRWSVCGKWELDRELERAELRGDPLSRLRFIENDHYAALPAIEIHGERGA